MRPEINDVFFDYCLKIAEEFDARLGRIRHFVTDHNLTTGNANESILREFLARHVPGNYEVGQGFICDIVDRSRVSKQCDILIYDQNNYAPVYSDGPIKIVQPASVRMVIEVKTQFSPTDISESLQNIAAARELNPKMWGIVFAFKSPAPKTVVKNLHASKIFYGADSGPTTIFLLDQGAIINNWMVSWLRDPTGPNDNADTYDLRRCTDKKGVVIAWLLYTVFMAVEGGGLIPSQPWNILAQTVRKHTTIELADFTIGSKP